jgi:hypothetical protein
VKKLQKSFWGIDKSCIFVVLKTTTTMNNTTTTIDKVRNYQGDNSFILNLKESLKKWGKLTEKQLSAAEKCLNGPVKTVSENLDPNVKMIVDYKGESTFVKDLGEKFKKWGTLTTKQIEAGVRAIQKENDRNATMEMSMMTPGQTILVGRSIGQKMKETYNLEFNPTLLDITKVLAVSPKAVKFAGKMTIKRGKVCMCCGRTLTDEFSMLTNMGKTCSTHMRIPYITDRSQAEQYREDYLKRVDEIGEMEFWVPRKQIREWNGKGKYVLRMM